MKQNRRSQLKFLKAQKQPQQNFTLPYQALSTITATIPAIQLKNVRKVPHNYLTWVPFNGYLQFDYEEPYLVYMGDSERCRKRADDLYSRMTKEYHLISGGKKLSCISDGEIDDDTGVFHEPLILNFDSRTVSNTNDLTNIRLRDAQRYCIFNVVCKHGASSVIFKLLSQALDMKHHKRVRLFYEIAKRRYLENSNRSQRLRKISLQNHQILHEILKQNKRKYSRRKIRHGIPNHGDDAIDEEGDEADDEADEDEDEDEDDSESRMPARWSNKAALSNAVHNLKACQHFCRYCMMFVCGIHDEHITTPRNPISDTYRDERADILKNARKGQVSPCCPNCFLYKSGKPYWNKRSGKTNEHEQSEWKRSEILLLYEAISIFQSDPCSLATVLGTKCCSEVYEKLKQPNQASWTNAIIDVSRKPIIPLPGDVDDGDDERGGMVMKNEPPCIESSSSEESLASCSSFRQEAATKSTRSGLFARKSTAVDSASIGSQINDYRKVLPVCSDDEVNGPKINREKGCDHDGLCNKENGCFCVLQGKYCDPSCRCRQGRYYYNEKSRNYAIIGEDCQQTATYCNCVDGKCNTNTCICRKFEVSCTPGACSCDSYLLPSQVKLKNRKCMNSNFIIGRHKKTFVGNSKVEGMGLFAGENFEKGEIIGNYYGLKWESNSSNLISMLGEEMKRTYSFELNEKWTIDASILGGKTRFANHGKSKDKCNCKSDVFYIRGRPYICLRATRNIPPGQEILFNYQLTTGANWIDKIK